MSDHFSDKDLDFIQKSASCATKNRWQTPKFVEINCSSTEEGTLTTSSDADTFNS